MKTSDVVTIVGTDKANKAYTIDVITPFGKLVFSIGNEWALIHSSTDVKEVSFNKCLFDMKDDGVYMNMVSKRL